MITVLKCNKKKKRQEDCVKNEKGKETRQGRKHSDVCTKETKKYFWSVKVTTRNYNGKLNDQDRKRFKEFKRKKLSRLCKGK